MFWLDYQLIDLGYTPRVSGDVGLEFEAETLGSVTPFATNYWTCKGENSLRNGAEWVLQRPVPISDVPRVVRDFFEAFSSYKMKLSNNSLRTSIHVHLNANGYTLRQIYTILTAYYLLEDILIAYSGPTRRGNLFCLGISAADQTIKPLVDNLIAKRHFLHIDKDGYKYAALNIPALLQFGSLEFRMMRGDYSDPDMIIEWVQQLHQTCERAAAMKDPKDVLFRFKGASPHQFLRLFFSAEFADKLSYIPGFQRMMRDNFHYSFALATGISSWATPKDNKEEPYIIPKKKKQYVTKAQMAQMASYAEMLQPSLTLGASWEPFGATPPTTLKKKSIDWSSSIMDELTDEQPSNW